MATIDYKEKYEQALERARQFSEKPYLEDSAGIVEYIFPELSESEDERIRKQTLKVLNYYKDEEKSEGRMPTEIEECIAWLEKQGEKDKFIEKELECIKGYRENAIKRLEELEKQGEQKPTDIKTTGYWCVEDVEQKPIDKVEPKFKVGDKVLVDGKVYTIKLVNEDNYIVDENGRDVQEHFSYTKDWKLYEQKPTAWSEEDETALGDALWCCKQAASIAKNENDMGNVWYAETWLKAIKDRVQPKQEWSEGDKRIIDNLISQLGNLYARKLIKEGTKDKYVNWLKNLKDKVFPQPNQEWSEVKSGFESLDSLIRTFNNYMKGE